MEESLDKLFEAFSNLEYRVKDLSHYLEHNQEIMEFVMHDNIQACLKKASIDFEDYSPRRPIVEEMDYIPERLLPIEEDRAYFKPVHKFVVLKRVLNYRDSVLIRFLSKDVEEVFETEDVVKKIKNIIVRFKEETELEFTKIQTGKWDCCTTEEGNRRDFRLIETTSNIHTAIPGWYEFQGYIPYQYVDTDSKYPDEVTYETLEAVKE